MTIRIVFLTVAGLFLLGPVPADAVDPPLDEGTAIICMYSDFDDVSGPLNGDIRYPEYFLLTPMDIYTVLYFPEGADQAVWAFEYGVRYRQGEHALEYGVHYGYLVNEWVPAAPGDIDLNFSADFMQVVVWPPCPHDGVAIVLRYSQILLLDVPLPGAAIEVFFEPFRPWHEHMHYIDQSDDEVLYDMLPNSEDHAHDNPVFVFEGDVVAVETRTLSAVKHLFR